MNRDDGTHEANPSPDVKSHFADIAAFADGSLDPDRRAEVSELIAGSPELMAALEEQRRVLALISRAGEVSAPPLLHERVRGMTEGRGVRPRLPARGRAPGSWAERSRQRRRGPLLALLAAMIVGVGAAVAIAVVLTSGSRAAPSLRAYLALAGQPATVAAPTRSTTDPSQLAIAVEGVAFPYWQHRFDWRASGARWDRVAGYPVATVFYTSRTRERVSYSIAAGPSGHLPGALTGTVSWRSGVPYRVGRANGVSVVSWLRADRRCVLSGRGPDAGTLLELASWGQRGEPAT